MSRAKKVLILALDSVNHAALAPHLDAGRMPTLKQILARGTSGILQSTVPAHTAAAWTTLSTGKHPGIHGVMNFRRFDPRTQETRLSATKDVPHKTVWQLLDEQGLNVGVVGQPQSYPLRPLKNGFAISGFETPSTDAEFAWPASLRAEVLERVPGFCFKSERVRDPGAGKDWTEWDDFKAGLESLSAENERAHALNKHLATSRPWDVLFLYYQSTDPLFHKAWRWCDPETRDEDPRRAAMIDAFFKRLDEMLAEIINLQQSQDAFIVVCSDHGHGPVHELVRVNGLLSDCGLLKRGGVMAQARDAWRRVTGQRKQKGLGIAVDWPETIAYMPFEAISGFVYINRLGRERFGRVNDAELESISAKVIAELSRQKSPHSGKPLFDSVLTTKQAYPNCGPFDQPEIFVQPACGVNLVRKLSFGPAVEIPEEKYKGTHRPEGFFALCGAGVNAGASGDASIADVPATVLALLGQPVPSDMTGRVLSSFFKEGLNFTSGAASTLDSAGNADVYSAAEKALVEQRLADLGYVD
jgi:predicted AlkP superfamily phosphohydrolase/phosphomutase